MEVLTPIYGISFKYLMEDDMSATVLLSALLRKKVETLPPRRETVKPVERRAGDLPICRLDYSAHIITADGLEEDVCEEIRKEWERVAAEIVSDLSGERRKNIPHMKKRAPRHRT